LDVKDAVLKQILLLKNAKAHKADNRSTKNAEYPVALLVIILVTLMNMPRYFKKSPPVRAGF